MKRARRELLAGAGLAAQQHDLRMGRQALNQAEDFLHRRAAAEHPAELQLPRDLALEGHHLGAPLELEADVDEHLAQAIEIKRLGQVLAGAELDRFDGAVDRGVGGHEDHFAARVGGANLPQQVEAVHVGHPQVDHREIGRSPHQRAHRFGAAPARDDLEAGLRRQALDDFQDRRLVVDDEQRGARATAALSTGIAHVATRIGARVAKSDTPVRCSISAHGDGPRMSKNHAAASPRTPDPAQLRDHVRGCDAGDCAPLCVIAQSRPRSPAPVPLDQSVVTAVAVVLPLMNGRP